MNTTKALTIWESLDNDHTIESIPMKDGSTFTIFKRNGIKVGNFYSLNDEHYCAYRDDNNPKEIKYPKELIELDDYFNDRGERLVDKSIIDEIVKMFITEDVRIRVVLSKSDKNVIGNMMCTKTLYKTCTNINESGTPLHFTMFINDEVKCSTDKKLCDAKPSKEIIDNYARIINQNDSLYTAQHGRIYRKYAERQYKNIKYFYILNEHIEYVCIERDIENIETKWTNEEWGKFGTSSAYVHNMSDERIAEGINYFIRHDKNNNWITIFREELNKRKKSYKDYKQLFR